MEIFTEWVGLEIEYVNDTRLRDSLRYNFSSYKNMAQEF